MKHKLLSISAMSALVILALLLTSCQKDNATSSIVSQSGIPSLAKEDNRTPDVPANLQVPAGNRVAFHVFAQGVQIYTCDGSAWVFKAPEATLYADEGGNGVVGKHYAGPTWESNSGSKVVGTRLRGATPDPNAIPWLLLKAVSNDGNGILAQVTYIQRVNTTGGKAPTTGCDASHPGEEVRVPYTAEYFFYRAEN